MSRSLRGALSSLLTVLLATLVGLSLVLSATPALAAESPADGEVPDGAADKAVVFGNVEDHLGARLDGVVVEAVAAGSGQLAASDVTGTDSESVPSGYFELTLDPGEYDFVFSPTEEHPQSGQLRIEGRVIETAGDHPFDTLVLPPAEEQPVDEPSDEPAAPLTEPVPAEGDAVIWGLVKKGSGPRYVADALVQALHVDGDGEAAASSLTYGGYGYSNGVFALYVPPGEYRVHITPPERLARAGARLEAVRVEAGDVHFMGTRSLAYPPGFLVKAQGARGPVGGATVRVTGTRSTDKDFSRTIDASGSGRAFFGDLPAVGRYQVMTTAVGHQPSYRRVNFDGTFRKAVVRLAPAPTPDAGESVIWGVVSKAGQRHFPQGLTVRAFPEGGDDGDPAASSITYGGYGFRGGVFALYVPAGDYRVVVTAPTDSGRVDLELGPVRVAPEEVRDVGLVRLPRPPGLLIRVTNRAGDRVDGAVVRATGPNGQVHEALTGDDGRAWLQDATVKGRYEVSAGKVGYQTSRWTVRLRENGRAKSSVRLMRAPVADSGQSVIWGVVRQAGKRKPLGNVEVQAFPVADGQAAEEPEATSLTYGGYGYRNGVFALYVPPGDYVVRIDAPEGTQRQDFEMEVSVGAEEVRQLGHVKLPAPPGIRVRVSDGFTRDRISGATVQITSPGGTPYDATTSADGKAFFPSASERGRYEVVVSKSGFSSVTTSVTLRKENARARVYLVPTPVAVDGQSVIWGVVKRAGSRRYVGDALVQAVPADGGAVAASSLTYGGYGYKNGVYALYVPPGDYVVKVFPPDGQSGEALESGPVSVAADEVQFLRPFKLAFEQVGVIAPPKILPTADLTEGDVVTVAPAEYSDESVVASRNYEWFALFSYTCGRAEDCTSRMSFARGPVTEVGLPSWSEGARIFVVETARSARGTRLARTQSELTDVVQGAPELVATGSPVFSTIPTQGQPVTPMGVTWNEDPDEVSYRWHVNGVLLERGDDRLTGGGSTFTPTVGDVGAWLYVEILATKAGYSPAYAYAYASRIKGVDERTRLLRIHVTKADGPDAGTDDDPVTDASVWLCSMSNCYSTTTRSGVFESEVPSAQAGIDYQVTVSPHSGGLLGTTRTVRVTNGSDALAASVKLEAVQPTPPAVRFPDNTPTRGEGGDSTPMGFIGSPLTPFTATGCIPVDSPTWTVTFANGSTSMTGGVRAGDTVEEPGSDPRTVAYTVRIPELTSSGHATIETNFVCGSPIRFTIYIDPSGYVTDQFGRTIAGAEVTLLRSTPGAGNFAPVADRDATVMDPAVNVRNPSLTDDTGFFRWDVAPGDYRVSVTRASSGGASCAVATTPTMSVPPIRVDLLVRTECVGATTPTPTTGPAVSGVREVGRVLELTNGAWDDGIRQTGIQWLRDGAPIAGATGNTYTLVAEDAGHSVTARVTAQRPDYAQENGSGAVVGFTAFTSPATGGGAVTVANPGNPGGGGGGGTPTPTVTNTAKPVVTGSAVVDGLLKAGNGTWSSDGLAFAYQWLRDGSPIVGATAAEYTPVVADLGKSVSVKVTATKTGSTPGTATSEAVTIAKGAAPQSSAAPEVTGTPALGETLTVSDGEWDLEDLTFGYQWLRDGEAIEGATEATYVVTEDDLGTELAAQVTASKAGHEDGSATSEGVVVPDEPEVVEPVESLTKARLLGRKVVQGERGQVKVKVTSDAESAPTGTVTVTAGGKSVEVDLTEADNGTLKVTLPKLKPGKHDVRVEYSGDDATLGSSDDAGTLRVTKKSTGKKGKGTKGKTKGTRTGGGRPMPVL